MPVDLHIRSWGSGARRILLLHGITSNAAGWWRVGPDLADQGWSVTAPDLRGHGSSPRTESYHFDEYVADLFALGSEWDAVLGHSMGGTITVLAASADPSWARGVVLQDPALMLPEPMSEMLDWVLEDHRLGADPARIASASPRWHARDVETNAESLRDLTEEAVTATVEQNWPWMVLDAAAALAVPTIVLGSDPEAGGALPVAFGEWLARSPLIEYEMIPGSSHSAHRDDDQYETYLSTLVAALGRLPTLGA